MHGATIVLDFWAGATVNAGTHFYDQQTNDYAYGSTQYDYMNDFCTSGTPLFNVINQYHDGTGQGLTSCSVYGGTWYYSSNAFPENPLSDADIQTQAVGVLNVLGISMGVGPNVEVFVFIPIGEGSHNFPAPWCAYHDWTIGFPTANHGFATIAYASMPDDGGTGTGTVCGSLPKPSPNGDPVADLEVTALSHEADESFTDPLLNAWYFNDASHEIGDECNMDFVGVNPDGSNVNMHGDLYRIQSEWSNSNGGCTLDLAGSPVQVAISLLPDSKSSSQNLPPSGFTVYFQEAGEGSTDSTTNCSDSCTIYVTPTGQNNVDIYPTNAYLPEEWCFDQNCDRLAYALKTATSLKYYFYDLLDQHSAYSSQDLSSASPAPVMRYYAAPSSPGGGDSPALRSFSLALFSQRFYVLRGTTVNVDASVGGSVSSLNGGSRWLTFPSQPTSWSPISSADQISNPVLYYHQYAITLDYQILGGGIPTAPTFSSTQLGAAFSTVLTTKPILYWLDSTASWSATNPLGGSSSTEQWVDKYDPTSGSVQYLNPHTLFYYTHQYLLTIKANPATVPPQTRPPTGSYWLDAGKKFPLSVVPAFGYVFTGWTGSGSGSCSGACSGGVTMNGSITETANFQVAPPSVNLAIFGPITPPSPPSGGITSSSKVTLEVQTRYCAGSCGPQPGVNVWVWVDGAVQCTGTSTSGTSGTSGAYFTCTFTTTQGTHSWYATAARVGFFNATSPSWTFTYNPSPYVLTYAVTANAQLGSFFAGACSRGLNPGRTVNVTLYSGSSAIAINTLTLGCSVPTGSVEFSMLKAGTYTVTITGDQVQTESQTATIPPNVTFSFTINPPGG